MRPVVEIVPPEGFGLWPVVETEQFALLPLHGGLTPAEVGTVMMGLAEYLRDDDLPPRPDDPVGHFLHGLLTADEGLCASGGLQVTDTSTGVVFRPGCCDGLEDWREWHRVTEAGEPLWYGHEPVTPAALPHGDTVRLVVDTLRSDSEVIEVSVDELRRLLAGAERDLAAFLVLAAGWASVHVPAYAAGVVDALARLVDLPAPEHPVPDFG
ncbi:hypothetical protein [Kitasatospora arboriphila]|uniref:SUKH-4 immunity protein of toxin-antitoxin system n=1 Tax=Kitasatospora arboriphila TaxID=258052 RepID=A0ABP4E8Z4_9ACTN